MLFKQVLALLLLVGVFTLQPYQAQSQERPLHLRAFPKGKQSDLKKEALYAVKIDCVRGTGELQPYEQWSGWTKTTYTTSLNILVSTQPPTKKTDNSDQLPSGTIAAATIFSTDGKTQPVDNRTACTQWYLVRRVKKLFLVPAINLSTTHEPGFFLALFSKVIDVSTSIMPLFLTGVPLTAATTKLADIKKVDDPLKNLIATLNQQKNYAGTVDLRVGTTRIVTDFNIVDITVRPVPSIVEYEDGVLIDELRKQIQGAPERLTSTDVPTTCIIAASTLNQAGITADKDKAYAIAYLALKSFADKNLIVGCLGGTYALIAAKLGDVLWKGEPKQVVVTEKDAIDAGAPQKPSTIQPSFSDARASLDSLMTGFGQYAKNKPTPPDTSNKIREAGKSRVRTVLSSTVTIVDNTYNAFVGLFDGAAQDYGFPDVLDALISKGFYHLGCFMEATDATGKYATGAVAIFLSFKAEPNATKVSKKQAIAIHPVFSGGMIHKFSVSDNGDWIGNVLSNRDKAYSCKDLQVEDDKVANVDSAKPH